MSSANWQRIEELFHAASELEDGARASFLARECADDETLRIQVESLLLKVNDERTFLNAPQLSLGLKVLSETSTDSLIGETISHYKITKLLGKGGMGEVYLADDCELERQVALKFLAPGLVDDRWAKQQLMREARAVAKLDNPNICAVYGIEQTEDHSFIVMQYIEGDTLTKWLNSSPLDLYQALSLSEQIADALAAAHARGIIHRDIKPQNILVNNNSAKVLDFGLAKFVQRQLGSEGAETAQMQTTQLGAVAGTVAYMSPEQTRGEPLDFRTDIFSFGIVLHEMLTGENPFLRESTEETVDAIRTCRPPNPANLPRAQREELAKIVSCCLEKDRTQRFETTNKLLLALRAQRKLLQRPDGAELLMRARHRRRQLQRYAVAATVVLIALLVAATYVRAKLTKVHSMAVIPIINQSTDPKASYISKGLTRNLLDKLAYLPRLRVRAPTEVAPRPSDHPDILKLGRQLNVDAVLFGQIQTDGVATSLHLEMLKTADGSLMWRDNFNLDAVDLFALQNDVTARVTSSLGMWFWGSERKLLTKRQTDNAEALNAYMKGRFHWGLQRNEENIRKAVGFFDQAISLDPSFAEAYAGRSDCYVLMTGVAYGSLPTEEAMSKARFDAKQAMEIDDSLPEAHTAMANVKLRYDWDWQQAEVEFKRAIQLDPEYAPAHYGYTLLLAILGRFEESINESRLARDLDPYSRLAQMNYGRALYYSGQYSAAADHFRNLIKIDPSYPQYLHLFGLTLIQMGQHDEAILALESLYTQRPLHAAASLGYAYAKAGRPEDASKMLAELNRIAKEKPVPVHEKMLIYLGLSEYNQVFPILEEEYRDRYANLIYLTTDPIFADLRLDSRFADLSRRIGLPR
jgi:eukaryotic-like serine/threonine-protein kinase